MSGTLFRLDFSQPLALPDQPQARERAACGEAVPAATASLFAEDGIEMPPTWAEDSLVFHITPKCNLFRRIRKNRRVTGKPGAALRQCFNCEDIIRAKRLG